MNQSFLRFRFFLVGLVGEKKISLGPPFILEGWLEGFSFGHVFSKLPQEESVFRFLSTPNTKVPRKR